MSDLSKQPPTIDLRGCRLRPLRAEDVDPWLAYLREPQVTEMTSYPVVTESLVEMMIQRSQGRWGAGEPSRWGVALRDDDRLIGTCGFNDHSPAHRRAELAYDLAPAYWGRGLMGQAVTAVLQWAFQGDQIDRVQAFVRIDNNRSRRLLERTGFSREGCLRQYRICRGEPHDFYVYSLLRSEGANAGGSEIVETRD